MTLSAAQLAQTHAAAFRDSRPWSAQEFTTLLETPGMILRGDVRSFVLGRVITDEAEVLTVATTPEFQRNGLGRACLQSFLSGARKRGAAIVFLEVAETNSAAKSLYLNEGFRESGRRPNYYDNADGTKSDAVMMQKAL